ncbi:hypothetical protein M1506_03625 [Patescibacteria group bacterium]|nr:hypothetical protein [Patescibacteria group bacterium]
MPAVNKNNKTRGQVMIIATIFMGGLFLVGTAIAGLLMFYQLRESGDIQSSASAIFAADAGVENSLYCYYNTVNLEHCTGMSVCGVETDISGGIYASSSISETCSNVNGVNIPTQFQVTSYGFANGAERVVERFFDLSNTYSP